MVSEIRNGDYIIDYSLRINRSRSINKWKMTTIMKMQKIKQINK